MNVTGQISDMQRHQLNNLFGKILGAAELAMDQPCGEQLRQELETITHLAEEGGVLLAASPDAQPPG